MLGLVSVVVVEVALDELVRPLQDDEPAVGRSARAQSKEALRELKLEVRPTESGSIQRGLTSS